MKFLYSLIIVFLTFSGNLTNTTPNVNLSPTIATVQGDEKKPTYIAIGSSSGNVFLYNLKTRKFERIWSINDDKDFGYNEWEQRKAYF